MSRRSGPEGPLERLGTARPLQAAPERANMRLEALRLAHRNDLSAEAIIERAGVLLAWIEQPADKPV